LLHVVIATVILLVPLEPAPLDRPRRRPPHRFLSQEPILMQQPPAVWHRCGGFVVLDSPPLLLWLRSGPSSRAGL